MANARAKFNKGEYNETKARQPGMPAGYSLHMLNIPMESHGDRITHILLGPDGGNFEVCSKAQGARLAMYLNKNKLPTNDDNIPAILF